jgi:hypothetical protein
MWSVVTSLDGILQGLFVVFTSPSFETQREILLGWLMCLGRRTEFRVFEAVLGQSVSRTRRHPFDRFYNFFSRSAWTVRDLAHSVAVQVVVALCPHGKLHLVVDATLLHKSGNDVYGIGWFHDPVASTKKRVATALGNQWVVLGLAIRLPGTERIFCLPIHALLQLPGKGQPGPTDLARQMLDDALVWFPDRQIVLIGDGGFSGKNLFVDLDRRVTYVGLMRGDAALHDENIPRRPKSRSGPKPKQGPRLPSPREAAKKADRNRSRRGPWRWKTIEVMAYGARRKFRVLSYQVLWPKVFGARPIQVVVCRALDKGYDEVCLFTTDLGADAVWVIETYARRTSIEAAFKDSKQVMEIQKPQHRCQESIEKLAPWVWLMQSTVALWYLTSGRKLPEARAARRRLGAWETEWSFRHMFRLLRRVTIRQSINTTSATKADLHQFIHHLENYLYLAA